MSKQAKEKLGKWVPATAATVGASATVALFPHVSAEFVQLIERVGFPGLFLWLVLRQHGPLLTDIKEQLAVLNGTLERMAVFTERRLGEIEHRVNSLEDKLMK